MIKENGEIDPPLHCPTCPLSCGCAWGCLRGDDLAEIACLRDRLTRMRAKYESSGIKCGRGHDNVLPVSLWDCPMCTEERRDRVERLEAALRKYGRHTEDCLAWAHYVPSGKPCSCGLDAALSPPPASEG